MSSTSQPTLPLIFATLVTESAEIQPARLLIASLRVIAEKFEPVSGLAVHHPASSNHINFSGDHCLP